MNLSCMGFIIFSRCPSGKVVQDFGLELSPSSVSELQPSFFIIAGLFDLAFASVKMQPQIRAVCVCRLVSVE